jgi:hypothetical protein
MNFSFAIMYPVYHFPVNVKQPNFRANPMSQLSCGITTAASRSQAAGGGVVAAGATVAEDREQIHGPYQERYSLLESLPAAV